jgi:hypothetical protein
MPAKDKFHEAVKHALTKDGWEITHDPLTFKIEGLNISIDLGAEKLIAAQKEGIKIAVEVKSFISHSPLTDFHTALGQFLTYRQFLQHEEPDRQLFLAVPMDTYRNFFLKEIIQETLTLHNIKLIVYDSLSEVIDLWIK